MMKKIFICYALFGTCMIVFLRTESFAQKMILDGKLGLAFSSGSGSSSGLLIGAGLDIPIQNQLYARPELNITTTGGTSIEMAGEVKYFGPTTTSVPLYIEGGLGLSFYSGGAGIGIDLGGGAIFPLEGSKLSIPAEIKLGPVFQSGNTIFQVTLSSGIRFNLH